jgi:hypothetical protein
MDPNFVKITSQIVYFSVITITISTNSVKLCKYLVYYNWYKLFCIIGGGAMSPPLDTPLLSRAHSRLRFIGNLCLCKPPLPQRIPVRRLSVKSTSPSLCWLPVSYLPPSSFCVNVRDQQRSETECYE